MTAKRRIIGLCGRAGSGKDSVAMALGNHGWNRIALADALKRVVGSVFGFTRQQLWGPSRMRNEIDPRWGFSPRTALQRVGTEGFRALHPDVWVRALLDEFEGGAGGLVVSDVRFPNELVALRAAGARIVRVNRPGLAPLDGAAGAHESEAHVDTLDVDLDLMNDGTLEQLEARALELPGLLWPEVAP